MKNCINPGLSIDISDLCYQYPKSRQLLHNISFSAVAGDRVCIVGPTMSGKTTLTRLIGGRLQPVSGAVSVYGEITNAQGLGVAPGDFSTLSEFVSYKVIEFNLKNMGIGNVLERCKLSDFSDHQLRQMGQSIRVRLALYLLYSSEPRIVILDTMPVGRDPDTQDIITPVFDHFTTSGGIVVFTSRKAPPSKFANVIVQISQ